MMPIIIGHQQLKVTNFNKPTLNEAIIQYLRLGLLSFGGPAAQIALMYRIFVDEKSWLSEKQYMSALSFCMLLPGPEAMQLATYVGWRLHGVLGGLAAGLLFVIPGAIVIFALSLLYVYFGQTDIVNSLFLGVKSVVLVIVIHALIRVSKKALRHTAHWIIAMLAFIAIFIFDINYPLVILASATYGLLTRNKDDYSTKEKITIQVSLASTLKTIIIWLVIWFLPILLVGVLTEWGFLYQISMFFSTLATVTFGGAYTVLAYMSQEVIFNYNWLTTGQMMDGLGLAETTPGPLILVTEFVGFIAGFNESGLLLASITVLFTLWATFVPCFLWIFVGAPYIEYISAQPRLANALSAITAAVVGVILSLSLWFALHVIFTVVTKDNFGIITTWSPDFSTINWLVVVLILLSYVLLVYKQLNILIVLVVVAILGVVLG